MPLKIHAASEIGDDGGVTLCGRRFFPSRRLRVTFYSDGRWDVAKGRLVVVD